MNPVERYLAVYYDGKRHQLDKVPSHVQYITEGFIAKNRKTILDNYTASLFNSDYFDIPLALGFDSIFVPFPPSLKIRPIKVQDENGKLVKIGQDGQNIKRITSYYEGGFINTIEILDDLYANLELLDNSELIRKTINRYEKMSSLIFPVLMVDGIFDRVWKSMGMKTFSRNFQKKTRLYQELIKFYAKLTQINIEGLIRATGSRGKVINILDDVAFKGRSMISPLRWEQDFLPYYKELTKIISDNSLIPQVHTDGDVTEMIPSFQKAGFLGLQGWEGGANPIFISEKFPDFVVIGFGDVSHILPFGTKSQVKEHVKELMIAFKENRHFIIGPSTVIFKEIPLENVIAFMNAVGKYGKY